MIEIDKLATMLSNSGELEKFTGKDQPIEHEVAYDLKEIVDSMKAVIEVEWPRILSGESSEVKSALHEIREHLRHLLYHVNDSSYFNLIIPSQTID